MPGFMTTILMVDDDPLQASLRKTILERKYQDVVRVADPAEALCLIEQPQFCARLGLVVSALHMPGMSGPAFVAELHERLPRLPVLVLGGSTEVAGDYLGGWVWFLPRQIANGDLLTAADELMLQFAWK
jgi:CheY-like chemotaxis protein